MYLKITRDLAFEFLNFGIFHRFFLLKLTCLVTLFDSTKLSNFGIFDELLSTQDIYLTRFACNIELDFFYDFQTLCYGTNLSKTT